MSQPDRRIYEFGAFRLDAKRRLLMKDGEALALSPKAVEILQVLVENRGRVVEKEELLQKVWPDSFVEEANLTVNMSALRKALGETKQHRPFIATVSGRGYRFVADVTVAVAHEVDALNASLGGNPDAGADLSSVPFADNQAAVAGTAAHGTDVIISEHMVSRLTVSASRSGALGLVGSPRNRILIGIAALALVSVLTYVVARSVFKPAPPVTAINSIAVLPFKPITPESANESLEMGMADTLITRFSSTGRIAVRPLSAVRKYAGADADPAAVGREIGVDAVLEGTIQPNGGRVRVTVRLVNSRTGLALWAEKFDESFDDIFEVQDRVSEKVAEALTISLTREERNRLTRHPTNSSGAYRAYLQGRFFWNKRTQAGLAKAMEYFDEALRIDPSFALAYSGLSDCHLFRSAELPPRQSMERAKDAAQKALALDNSLAEAHTSIARVKQFYDWDWPGAEQEFRRAIDLDPNYATAHHWYSQYLLDLGRYEEAVKEIYRARELDPTSLIINCDVGSLLRDSGQYDDAIAAYRTVITMDPSFARVHLELGRALTQKGLYNEAEAEINRSLELSGRIPGSVAALGYVYAVAGKPRQARELIAELEQMKPAVYVSPYSLALIHAGLGEKDQALDLLQQAYQDRFGLMAYLKVELRFDNVRSDSRFADLMRRLGLPQ